MPSLPPAPDGYNAYTYWHAIVHSVYYRTPPPSFKKHMIALFCLLGYVVFVALAYLTLTVVDYRRQKKSLWLWRLVNRQSGRFIVGNQQLLEPILTLIVLAVSFGTLQNDYDVLINGGSEEQSAAWRIAPWSAIFLQSWIVSWASMQSFILLSGERGAGMKWFSARVANYTFLVIGVLNAIALLVFDIIVSVYARKLWAIFTSLERALSAAEPTWTGAPDPVVMAPLNELWTEFLQRIGTVVTLSRGILALFSTTPLLTAFVNLSSLGLILVVRRQIKANYSNFMSGQSGLSTSMWPTSNIPTSPIVEFAPTFGAVADAIGTTTTTSVSAPPPPASSLQAPPVQVTLSLASPAPSITGSRMATRAEVRQMAARTQGGANTEHAKNLMHLQRAEIFLVVTGVSLMVQSLAFSGASIWVCAALTSFAGKPFVYTELALLFGTWLYGGLYGITLTIHVYNSWLYLSPKDHPEDETTRTSPAMSSRRETRNNSLVRAFNAGPDGVWDDEEEGGEDEPTSGSEMGEKARSEEKERVAAGQVLELVTVQPL